MNEWRKRVHRLAQRIALTRLNQADDEWASVLQSGVSLDGYRAVYDEVTRDQAVDWMLRAKENPSSVLSSIGAARQNARRKAARLRLNVDGQEHPVLRMWKTGFAIPAEGAPQLRGLVDLYDGATHLLQCLIVKTDEEGGEMRYEFKRATAVAQSAALDFERFEKAPAALITDAR